MINDLLKYNVLIYYGSYSTIKVYETNIIHNSLRYFESLKSNIREAGVVLRKKWCSTKKSHPDEVRRCARYPKSLTRH